MRRFHNFFVPLVVAGLVLAACGGNSDSSGRTRNAAIDASQPPCISDPALEYDETGSPLFVFTPCVGAASVLSPLGVVGRMTLIAGERVQYPVILQVGGVTEFPLTSFSADGQQVGVDDVKITLTPCKDGGPCQVGDIGPKSGLVVASFTDGAKKYVELAPKNWNGDESVPFEFVPGPENTNDGVGKATLNVDLVNVLSLTLSSALRAYQGDDMSSEWLLPTYAELEAAIDLLKTNPNDTFAFLNPGTYASSTVIDEVYYLHNGSAPVRKSFLTTAELLARPVRYFSPTAAEQPVINVTSTFVRGDSNSNEDNSSVGSGTDGEQNAQPDNGETTTTTSDSSTEKVPVITDITMIGEGMNRQVSVSWMPAAAEPTAPLLVILDPAQDNREVYWQEATIGSVVFMASMFPPNQTYTAVIREANGNGGIVQSSEKDFIPNTISATENFELIAPSDFNITPGGTSVVFDWQFPMNHESHAEQLAYLITSTDEARPFTIYAGNSNSVATSLKAFEPGVEYEFVVKQVFAGAGQRPLDDSASSPSNSMRIVPRLILDDATRAREKSECDIDPVITVGKTDGVTTSDLVQVKLSHPCISSTAADDVVAFIAIESKGGKESAIRRCIGRPERFRKCDEVSSPTFFDAAGFFEPGKIHISVNFNMVFLGANIEEDDVLINRTSSVSFDVTGNPVCGIEDITVTATDASLNCPEGVRAAVTVASRDLLANQDQAALAKATLVLTSNQRLPLATRLEGWTPIVLEVDRGFGGEGGIAFFCETDCENWLGSWKLPITVDDQGFALNRDRLKVPTCPNENITFESNEIDFQAITLRKLKNGLFTESYDDYFDNRSAFLDVSNGQLRGTWPSGEVIVVLVAYLPCGKGSNVFDFAVLNPPVSSRAGATSPTNVETAPMANLGLVSDATVAGQFVAPPNANYILLSDSDKVTARANEIAVRVDDGEWVSLGGIFTSGFALPQSAKKLQIRTTIDGKESVFARDIARSDEGEVVMASLQPGGEIPVTATGSQVISGVTSSDSDETDSPVFPVVIVVLIVLGGGALVLRRRRTMA